MLAGLGYTQRQEAVPLLVEALMSKSSWTRMDAASALGKPPGPASVGALLGTVDDPEYLVRYHTIRSLGVSVTRLPLNSYSRWRSTVPTKASPP